MTRLRGRCLCDAVSFEVRASALKRCRCHCTLCRRQSGTASNCAAIVDAADFAWVSGAGQIRSWRKATGYRSDVCGVCGSPVPNPLESRAAFWVPAGLLDPGGVLSVVADFHLDSKAAWDDVSPPGHAFATFPEVDEFFALMHHGAAPR